MNILKTALIAATITVSMMPVAEARINTLDLTCNQARSLVYSRGGIVLSTGRHTFDRFVADRSFCPDGDYTKRAYVPTLDRRSCKIGYTCTSDNPYERHGN
jgi:hypothetical protein